MRAFGVLDQHLTALRRDHAARSRAVSEIAGLAKPEDIGDFVLSTIDDQPAAARGAAAASSMSSAISKRTEFNARGLWVPFTLSRDLTVGTLTAGGHVTEGLHDGGLIESLRPHSVAVQAGAMVVTGLRAGSLVLPRLAGASVAGWIGENEDAPTGDPSFAQVAIVPRTVAVTTTVSRRLAKQTSVRDLIRGSLVAELTSALMSEIDRVVLAGSGSGNEPQGILNNPDVTVVAAGTNGGAPTWSLLADLEHAASSAGDSGPVSWVTNADVRRKLRKTPRLSGGDGLVWDGSGLLGSPAYVTEHVPSDLDKGDSVGVCSAAICGAFRQVVIGFWGPAAFDLVVDPYTAGNRGAVRIAALVDIGVGLRHPGAFAVAKDLLTT